MKIIEFCQRASTKVETKEMPQNGFPNQLEGIEMKSRNSSSSPFEDFEEEHGSEQAPGSRWLTSGRTDVNVTTASSTCVG